MYRSILAITIVLSISAVLATQTALADQKIIEFVPAEDTTSMPIGPDNQPYSVVGSPVLPSSLSGPGHLGQPPLLNFTPSFGRVSTGQSSPPPQFRGQLPDRAPTAEDIQILQQRFRAGLPPSRISATAGSGTAVGNRAATGIPMWLRSDGNPANLSGDAARGYREKIANEKFTAPPLPRSLSAANMARQQGEDIPDVVKAINRANEDRNARAAVVRSLTQSRSRSPKTLNTEALRQLARPAHPTPQAIQKRLSRSSPQNRRNPRANNTEE